MKIGIVYTGITSYMTDCWKCLARQKDVAVKIWVEERNHGDTAFDRAKMLEGLDVKLYFTETVSDVERQSVVDEIAAFRPAVVFICGWSRRLPPYVAHAKELADIPMVLDFDMPWEWRLRKIIAMFALRPRLNRFSAAFVPGTDAARYARRLGFPHNRIYTGRNCIDVVRFRSVPRKDVIRTGFLFVGRLVEAKNIKGLVRWYGRYRASGGDWPLDVYGKGPEAWRLKEVEGIRVHGFVQPDDLPLVYGRAHTLVLPSNWEPWGMVALEALASGCKVICSNACGVKEVVRRCERDPNAIEEYSCEKWCARVMKITQELKNG